ncbi:MAG: hypothetical protein U0527_15925 [Candidatus Eisenbacteria bacterium]
MIPRSRRAPRFRLAVEVAGAAAFLFVASSSHAQFIAYESHLAELPLFDSRSSARLLGMGGLELVIPDENREINLFDFGRNLAGLAADKDGWSLETQYGRLIDALDYSSELGGAPIAQRQVINQHSANTQIIFRQGGRRAVGTTIQFDSQDQDYRFGADNLMRGPRVSGYYNDRFGPVSLAIGLTRWTDNEDVASPDIFSIRHESSTWLVNLAAATRAAGFEWGVEADFENVTIRGKSRDAAGFHQDEFQWRRPATNLRATAILARPGRLQAGFNLASGSRNGTEEAKISWADRFPQNPGRFYYAVRVPTFHEEESEWSLEGRASYRLQGSLRASLYGNTSGFSSDVTEAGNWIGSRRAQKLDDANARVGGGLSKGFVGDRVLVGLEGFGIFRTRDLTLSRAKSSISSRQLAGTLGAEWMVGPGFAVRGGYLVRNNDEDVDAPETLSKGNGWSLGFGYLPRGGMVALDGAVRSVGLDPDGTTSTNLRTDQTEYLVAARFIL